MKAHIDMYQIIFLTGTKYFAQLALQLTSMKPGLAVHSPAAAHPSQDGFSSAVATAKSRVNNKQRPIFFPFCFAVYLSVEFNS